MVMPRFPSFSDPMEQLYQSPGGPANIFGEYLQRRLPRGASQLYRNYAEKQQDPYQNVFQQLRGLGDIGPRGSLDAPGGNFADFADMQPTVAAPDPGYLRSLAGRANQLIQGPQTGLRSAPLAYRQQLIETPSSQFDLALQSVLPSVPQELSGWLRRVAQDAFDRFMVQNPQGTTEPQQGFLPQFVNRGYSFF